MKKLCTLLLTSMVAIGSMAQDAIITKNDELIKVYNLEIGNNAIFYTLEDHNDAPINKMAKDDIFIIKKADGTKIDLSNEAQPAPVNTTKAEPAQNTALNKQLISDWNDFKYELTNFKPTSTAKHNNMLVKLGYKSTSKLSDENIAVHYEIEKLYNVTYGLTCVIKVENLSDKILFVDMANSAYTSNNGVKAMYSNAVTSNTKVGVVAAVLPIIGGASASANTTTKAELRMIPVPPHSIISLPYKINSPFRRYTEEPLLINPIQDLSVSTLEELPMGQSLFFNEQDATREMYVILAYSFKEDGEKEHFVRTDFYLQQILKLGYCPSGSFFDTKIGVDKLNKQRIDGPVFVPIDSYNNGHYVNYKWFCKP